MIHRNKAVMVNEYKVMIVDDSFLMRNVVKNILDKDDNFVVIAEASDGQEALELLDSVEPDIILLDIEMPVMDGIQFLQESKLKTHAKIIVISSIVNINSPQARQVLALGAVDLVNKPSGVLSVDLEEEKSIEILDALHRCIDLTL